jgi:hypothetical protein
MTVACRLCRQWHEVDCTEEQYLRWREGGSPIQNVMPDVLAAERELLISGACNECWQQIFRNEEEE